MSKANPVIYDFESISVQFVHKAANYIARRYGDFGVTHEEVCSEMWVWLYDTPGRKRTEKYLASEPQQTTRIYRDLLDVGIRYGETEKAERSGYAVEDNRYYSPKLVGDILLCALDEDYAGKAGVTDTPGGEWLAMVLDVRRVLTLRQRAYFLAFGDDHPDYAAELQNVVNQLGGSRPGRRKVLSNAAAIAATGEVY